jgi:hypothetical protein
MQELLLTALFATAPPDSMLTFPPGRPLVAIMSPGTAEARREFAVVVLPLRTPYRFGSADEAWYLAGYARGHADAVRVRLVCRTNGTFSQEGWQAGYAAAKPKAP